MKAERTRARRRGVVLYILAAAISWGTFSALFLRFVWLLLEYDLDAQTLVAAYRSRDFLEFWGWCLLAGLLLGLLLWFFYQWQYRKIGKEQP
ncbi:MAG: hypothetical protein IPM98_11975 [Lewinellaceae bacterium]|nr:hypothetical protein [Lewinellaceae bacterium]